MNQQFQAAIDVLLEQLESEVAAVANTKRTINSLCKRIDQPEMFPEVETDSERIGRSVRVRPDQFYGKKLATVISEYLRMRGQACRVEEIIAGLKEGGFDFKTGAGWADEKGYNRSMAMAMVKNSKTFHRLPNGTFGLPAWYPEATRARRAAADSAEAAGQDVEE